MGAIYTRELKSYYTGLTGYVFALFILLFGGIYTAVINLANGVTSFEYVFSGMSFVFIVVIPVLTMRVLAEEKRQKTDLLLYSLPRSMAGIVIGKYLAMVTVLAIPLVVLGVYPIVLNMYGDVNLAVAYNGLLGFFLLGASLIAAGMLVSAFAENQAVAAAISFVVVLINYFLSDLASYLSTSAIVSFWGIFLLLVVAVLIIHHLTHSTWASGLVAIVGVAALVITYKINSSLFESLLPNLLTSLSVFDRFYEFVEGLFDLQAVCFFLVVIALLNFYTVQVMEKRRWS